MLSDDFPRHPAPSYLEPIISWFPLGLVLRMRNVLVLVDEPNYICTGQKTLKCILIDTLSIVRPCFVS